MQLTWPARGICRELNLGHGRATSRRLGPTGFRNGAAHGQYVLALPGSSAKSTRRARIRGSSETRSHSPSSKAADHRTSSSGSFDKVRRASATGSNTPPAHCDKLPGTAKRTFEIEVVGVGRVRCRSRNSNPPVAGSGSTPSVPRPPRPAGPDHRSHHRGTRRRIAHRPHAHCAVCSCQARTLGPPFTPGVFVDCGSGSGQDLNR